MKKRMLAVLLAVCLVLAAGTIGASAEGDTLPKPDDGVITLTGDVTLSSTWQVSDEVTLDLAGHKLNATNGHTIVVLSGGELTVVDSSEEADGVVDVSEHAKAPLYVSEGGTAEIKGGKFTRSCEASKSSSDNGGNSWYTVYIEGTLTISGGTIENNSMFSSLIRNCGKLYITGGTIRQDDFIAVKNEGTLYISGGQINSDNEQAIQNWSDAYMESGEVNGLVYNWSYPESSGHFNMSDGEVNGNIYTVNYQDISETDKPSVTLTGGTVNGNIAIAVSGIDLSNADAAVKVESATVNGSVSLSGKATAEIVGSTITGNVATNGAQATVSGSTVEGSVGDDAVVENTTVGGVYIENSVPEDVAAIIGGRHYASLNDAVADVKSGETIYIVKDIPNATGIKVASGSNFTIDFGGHTYTLVGPGTGSVGTETNAFQLLRGSTITMKNGTIRISEDNLDIVPTSERKPIMRIIQNYCDLTLENMHIYAKNQYGGEDYVLSFNCGSITFKGDTDIVTSSEDKIAFDVCYWLDGGYTEGVYVTFADDYSGSINGKVIYDSSDPEKGSLEINGAGYIGSVEISAASNKGVDITVTGGSFGASMDGVADVLPDYELKSNGTYIYYDTLSEALAAQGTLGGTVEYVGELADGESEPNAVKYVNNGETVEFSVPDGTSITLPYVSERDGYYFGGWSCGGKLYDEGETVTVYSNMTFTARWYAVSLPDTYPITVGSAANGSVDVSFSNASKGSVITITAVPDEGYSVGAVTVSGPAGAVEVKRLSATEYSFVMPEGSVTVSVSFVSAAEPFADVEPGDWFYEAVSYVYANGMMQGESATLFNPDAQMTRAMVWATLARLDGEIVTGAGWIEAARAWAVASGVSDGTNANGYITRQELVTMLYRYAGSPDASGSLAGFTDAGSVAAWAADAMAWAVNSGIISGMTEDTIVPAGNATRAQCAAIFMRYAA